MSIHVTGLGTVVPLRSNDQSMAFPHDLLHLLECAELSAEGNQNVAREYIKRARTLLAEPAPSLKIGGLAPWQIKRIERHIEDYMETGIKLAGLAQAARLSPSYFCKAFKTSFGSSPLAYVQQKRIDRAKKLMLTTDSPLADIALECGLCDQAHFSRMFKKLTAHSPKQWRRNFMAETE